MAAHALLKCRNADGISADDAPVNISSAISLGILTHNNIEVVKTINRSCLPICYGERFYTSIICSRELCRIAYVQDIPVGAICCQLFHDDEEVGLCEDIDNNSETKVAGIATSERSRTWELSASYNALSKAKISGKHARLGILTLAVLAPYRRMGIGKQYLCIIVATIGRLLMKWVEDRCQELRQGTAAVLTGPIPGVTLGVPINVTEIFLHVWSANPDAVKFYEALGFEITESIKGYYKRLNPDDCVVLKKRILD